MYSLLVIRIDHWNYYRSEGVMTDKEQDAEIVNVVCYQTVAHNFTNRSRWRVRGTEPRGKGKVVVILERVKK